MLNHSQSFHKQPVKFSASYYKEFLRKSVLRKHYFTGAQIRLLRGNASVPHPLLWRNEASLLAQCELCTSLLHSNRLFVYIVCCRRRGQCFSVLRTRHTDIVGDSSGRSYVTEQWHNVPLLRTRAVFYHWRDRAVRIPWMKDTVFTSYRCPQKCLHINFFNLRSVIHARPLPLYVDNCVSSPVQYLLYCAKPS